MNHRLKFPSPPRECLGCRVPLRPSERLHCRQCETGGDFYQAAVAFQRANPRPKGRRWAR